MEILQSLDYHQLLNICRFLSPNDIDNLFKVISRPLRDNFWVDLIYHRYNLLISEGKREDFTTLYSYFHPKDPIDVDRDFEEFFYQEIIGIIFELASHTVIGEGSYYFNSTHHVVIQGSNQIYALLNLDNYLQEKGYSHPLVNLDDYPEAQLISSLIANIDRIHQMNSRITYGSLEKTLGKTLTQLNRDYQDFIEQIDRLINQIIGDLISYCHINGLLNPITKKEVISRLDQYFHQAGDPIYLENFPIKL